MRNIQGKQNYKSSKNNIENQIILDYYKGNTVFKNQRSIQSIEALPNLSVKNIMPS